MWRLSLTTITSQILWRVAWQLHQSISSGSWDAPPCCPQTCAHSGSLGGHDPDFTSSRRDSALPVCILLSFQPGGVGREKIEVKQLWNTSAFCTPVVTSSPALCIRGDSSPLIILFWLTSLQKPLLLFVSLAGSAPVFPNPNPSP